MFNYLSDLLDNKSELDDIGVFDPILDVDTNYFINIVRLKATKIPEFMDAYDKVNSRFQQIGLLLSMSKDKSDKFYRSAVKLFDFHEVNGICLGYSSSAHGAGFGDSLRERIMDDAKTIIDAGVNEPELFHLVGLFEDNVGPDRLSDMIASIISENIFSYTRRVLNDLMINNENYPDLVFEENLLINPYKGIPVLLLPSEILHELPIARDWEDIDRVSNEIQSIRNEINEIIGMNWNELTTSKKKKFYKEHIMNNTDVLSDIIEEYRNYNVDEYDFTKDKVGDYVIARLAKKSLNKITTTIDHSGSKSSFDIAIIICNKFKDLVENNKGYELFYVDDKPRKEKIVQRAFYCIAEALCEANNLDISPESDSGRGPVDFKFSNNYQDRTVVELKLTTNQNLVHGYEKQIEEYAKAEKTKNMIYLVVHNGGPQSRIDKLNELYKSSKEKGDCPSIYFVDARPKVSASKYKGS